MPPEVEGVFLGAIGNTPEGYVWIVGTRTYSVYEVEVFYFRARKGEIDRIDSFIFRNQSQGIYAAGVPSEY